MSTTFSKITTRHTANTTPRSGHKKITNTRNERNIIRYARLHPKWTYSKLRDHTGLQLSTRTFYRILRQHGIINWRCKRRPELTAGYARLRLQFARQWINANWSNVLFSDECFIKKSASKKRRWAFGYPDEKWQPDKIETYNKGKGVRVMVWCVIGASIERSELIIISQDENSPRSGYSASSYIEVLEEGLVPVYNGQTFV